MNNLKANQVLKAPTTTKKFYQSQNFWTNVASIVFMIAALFGINFPDGMDEQIGTAITTQNWLLLITAGWNAANIVIKFVRSKRPQQDVEAIVDAAVAKAAEKYLKL